MSAWDTRDFLAQPYKSRPTMFSSTELFPLDCDPTTAIWGKSIGFCTWWEHGVSGGWGRSCTVETHANSGEDILQLIDERDKAWVVDIDPSRKVSIYEYWTAKSTFLRVARWRGHGCLVEKRGQ